MGIFKKVENQKIIIGRIIDVDYKDFSNGRPTFYAHVEYIVDGETYVVSSTYSSSLYHIGRKIRIAYNKENPGDSIVKPLFSHYLSVAMFLVTAIIVTAFMV